MCGTNFFPDKGECTQAPVVTVKDQPFLSLAGKDGEEQADDKSISGSGPNDICFFVGISIEATGTNTRLSAELIPPANDGPWHVDFTAFNNPTDEIKTKVSCIAVRPSDDK
ncbi:hypothetical protein GCM10007385_46660 [Tateyamaria omphalii]|nr:hypothetical protein GCM10007385_46660 [Tateyamaria omphalii]